MYNKVISQISGKRYCILCVIETYIQNFFVCEYDFLLICGAKLSVTLENRLLKYELNENNQQYARTVFYSC